jgi:hypothetical protein
MYVKSFYAIITLLSPSRNFLKSSTIFCESFSVDMFLKYLILNRLFDHTEIIMEELCSCQSDMVSISVVSDNFPWVPRLSQRIKQELNVSIVFGEVCLIFVPEYIV